MSIPRTPIDWKHYDHCHAKGISDTAFAESIGLSQPAFSHRKKKRHLEELNPSANGAPPSAPESAPLVPIGDTMPERLEVVGEPMGAPDSAPESAPRLHDLEARVSVLEAFIATMQRQSGALGGALRSAPTLATKKRGFVIACDLSDALDHYAEMSGLQVRDILDMALRRYLADVAGEEVHRG
jgi:hypothetical protein